MNGSDLMNTLLRKFVVVGLLFMLFFSYTVKVNASSLNSGNTAFGITLAETNSDCRTYFGDPDDVTSPAHWMQFVLDVMKYIAIVALLGLVTMDFFKALVANDKDAIKKASGTAIKRFIYCVILFFLPMIVEIIMELFGAYGPCVG